MGNEDRFPLLRRILGALGLSSEAIEDIVERILDWLSTKDEPTAGTAVFPFRRREDFLSPCELSFFLVLRTVVGIRAQICPKVALGDLFFAETGNRQKNRAFANRIDRKHVDFVLCEPKSMRPLLGLELDDKSHDREDRKKRDELVAGVFAAAGLSLVRVAAKAAYSPAELEALLAAHLGVTPATESLPPAKEKCATRPTAPPDISGAAGTQFCPKCGGEMLLRTAKTGANAGGKFWGCKNFPKCRAVVANDAPAEAPQR